MKWHTLVILSVFLIAGCGSATEVGNPTSEVPRTITGMIDESTIEGVDFDASVLLDYEYAAINLQDLTVVATPVGDSADITAPVDADGFFSIEVYVGTIYFFDVRSDGDRVGDFSFEEDNLGNRGSYIDLESEGDPIDLGTVRFEGGKFRPENEPRHHMPPSGGGGGPPPPPMP